MMVADFLNLKPGVKISLDQVAQRACEWLLAKTQVVGCTKAG